MTLDNGYLYAKTLAQLKVIAKQSGIKLPSGAAKAQIIEIVIANMEQQEAAKTAAESKAPAEEKPKKASTRVKKAEEKPAEKETAEKKPAKKKTAAKKETKAEKPVRIAPEKQPGMKEEPLPAEQPAMQEEPVPAEQPAMQEEPVPAEQPDADNDDTPRQEAGEGRGVLEIMPDGYGFLRHENCLPGQHDVYLSQIMIRRFGLREGDYIVGKTRPQRDTDRYEGMIYVSSVNGIPADQSRRRKWFDEFTPVFPMERLRLESREGGSDLALRTVDLIAPIGKGQRGLIVSPPKAGKTELIKKIANAITENNPEVELIVLLIDERPEEVTDMQRSTHAEVLYSTFDEEPDHHTRLAEMVLEKARRQVEVGKDVVILLDSITRLARAYNLTINPTGRSLSGGLDPGAFIGPKHFFGSARNMENGGSLTILATALIDTGSRMDDIIYEEFKGTGNMELHLDRKLSERRVFPAIDITRSGTRRDELLYTSAEAEGALMIRRNIAGGTDNTEQLISLMAKTRTNGEFISRLKGWLGMFK